jgi:Fungal specific transcription factor domain
VQRKCHHTFAQETVQPSHAFQEHCEPEKSLEAEVASQPKHSDSVRFVGDLNPESVLADLSDGAEGSTRKCRVGVWIGACRGKVESPPRSCAEDRIHHAASSSSSRPQVTTLAPQHPHLKRFLQDTGAFTVLPKPSQKSLVEIYTAHVHPFLPLIDLDAFLSQFERGEASNSLVLAICLTASRSSEAARFLRWEPDGPLVPARIFGQKLAEGLHFAINTGQESDALTKIQILGLLALHNDGPQGLETASLHLGQAIHHAHTLGLHIDAPRTGGRHGFTGKLFWSLWCLDKFHACMAGRPVHIFDRDVGLARPTPTDRPSETLFLQHFALCELLADIIHYYRPSTDQDSTGWEDGFPTLEEIMSKWSGGCKHDSSRYFQGWIVEEAECD